MVSDTAISGAVADLRRRENYPKIEPSKDQNALIGFAGDLELGAHFTRLAARQLTSARAIEILARGSRDACVEFAYAYFEAASPRLLHIENGKIQSVPTLHLGVHKAFEQL